jgi:dipeptidyl-peptidase-4
LAQRGFIVFTLDNRGSGFRGRQFESALYLRMGSIEVEDQVIGVQFLRSQPWVDAKRMGVFGWSYGGYMSLMSMVRAPEFFAAGVAGAPVTDWRLYDTHYTERYMGTPESNPRGYTDGMVMTHAPALSGPLLIMHGMADDNVLFSHATALFKRLQDLGKPFSVMPYPGSKHGLLRFSDTGPHAYTTILDFFEDKLKPVSIPPDTQP